MREGAERGSIAGLLVQFAFPLRIGLPAATTIFAFVVGLVVGLSAAPYETAFYEATSQVIPVLLLVLAVEARFFRIDQVPFKQLRESFEAELTETLDALGKDSSPRRMLGAALALPSGRSFAYVQQRLVMVLALLTLVAGEVASVLVLGQPSLESPAVQGLVLGATLTGLGAVTIAALIGPMPGDGPPASP